MGLQEMRRKTLERLPKMREFNVLLRQKPMAPVQRHSKLGSAESWPLMPIDKPASKEFGSHPQLTMTPSQFHPPQTQKKSPLKPTMALIDVETISRHPTWTLSEEESHFSPAIGVLQLKH